MTLSFDALVIGGGIVGLMTARELALAGYRTAVIDRQQIGQEASWAGGGILAPIYPWRQPVANLTLWQESLRLYPQLVAELRESTGIDPELRQSGLVLLDELTPETHDWCSRNQVSAQRLDKLQMTELLPNAQFEQQTALWLPRTAQVRNPRLLAGLKIDLRNRGVTLVEHQEVRQFTVKKERIRAVKSNQTTFFADEVLIAAGAWSNFAAETWEQPEISPVKGQMLLYKSAPGLLNPILAYRDRYIIPRSDGHILVGSTVEFAGFDKHTTVDARHQLESFALDLVPALIECPLINHWAGLRPGSRDGIPYICRHPRIANLSYNCGHYRNGLGFAPASARLLTDLIIQRQSSISPGPYGMGR